jgi:tetratricopeptide (TPR) repeat protein
MSITPAAVKRKPQPASAPKALLQLSASRGKLALELAAPYPVGPLEITKLIASLDGLQFPVDLSGGVARFRHRRGSLERLTVDVRLALLAGFLEPKARSALDAPRLKLSLLPADYGLTVGVHDDTLTLAFTLLFAPDEDQLRFVVSNARGFGVGRHAHAVALRLARTLCGPNAERRGSLVTLDRPLLRLVREALLDAGARLPSCQGVRFLWMDTDDGVRLVANRSSGEDIPPPHVVRGMELARIAQHGDDALAQDRLDEARAAYQQALEAAPRHPDIALRIAELDTILEHSPDTALASIVETMPAVDGGMVAARLLYALGDKEAAAVAARLAAEDESFAPLAARILAEAASYSTELSETLAVLDEAVARCPSCTSVRWQRVRHRLAFGLSQDAVADLGQLEAGARGSSARFDVCLEAGRLLMDARQHHEARIFFERALRCVPRSAPASVGLGRAFLATGDPKRGVALLSRAVTLLKAGDPQSPTFVLELAEALAEHAQDLPAAIFHARSVPFGLCETIAARALEGRWRNQLGDRVGASQAFARAREAAAQLPRPTIAAHADWLLEAAAFELDVARDPRTAKRHAELALQAAPHDPKTIALFRRAALAEQSLAFDTPTASSEPALQPSEPHVDPPDSVVPEARHTEPPPPAPATLPPPDLFEDLEADSADEQRIERLTDVIRANPEDQDAVRELCGLLERAERHLDLMALVSARLDETADEAFRSDLTEVQKRTLMALIATCRNEGRPDEAEMYEMVLSSLE